MSRLSCSLKTLRVHELPRQCTLYRQLAPPEAGRSRPCRRRAAAMAEQMVVEGDVRQSQLPTRAATVACSPPPFALSLMNGAAQVSSLAASLPDAAAAALFPLGPRLASDQMGINGLENPATARIRDLGAPCRRVGWGRVGWGRRDSRQFIMIARPSWPAGTRSGHPPRSTPKAPGYAGASAPPSRRAALDERTSTAPVCRRHQRRSPPPASSLD